MAISFGDDYSTFRADGSYGLTYVRITGARVPLEGVARAWLTEPGSLFWAPNFGFGLSRLQNAAHREDVLGLFKSFLVRSAKGIDFVMRADVEIAYAYADATLTVAGRITLADFTTHPLLVSASDAAAATVQFPSSPLAATA